MALLLATQAEPKKATQLLSQAESNPAAAFAASEQEIFGFTHGQPGMRLAAKWGFPDSSAAAIAWHHEPDQAPETHRPLCKLIYIADTLASGAQVGCPLTCSTQAVNLEQLIEAKIEPEIAAAVTAKLPILLRLYMS
ncbi:hypothetical protein BH09PLA1_BH09PLA1_29740 [soil metagenome]